MAERANGILLDTSVVIAHLRGSVDLQTLASPDEPLFLPLVALGELYRGVLKSARPESNRAKVDEFLDVAAVLYPDVATAEIYAQIAHAWMRRARRFQKMISGLQPCHWNVTCRWLRVTTTSDKSKSSICFGGDTCNSCQIWQLGRGAGQGIFPNCDAELMNFLAIVTNQALDHCSRNPGFVEQGRSGPTQTVK